MEKELHSEKHLEQQFQPVAINAGHWDTDMADLQGRICPVTQFQLGIKGGDDSMSDSIDSLTHDAFHMVKENYDFCDPVEPFSTSELTNKEDRQSEVTTNSELVEIKEAKQSANIIVLYGNTHLPLNGSSIRIEAVKKCTDGIYLGSKSDHFICESISKGLDIPKKSLTNKNKSSMPQIVSDAVSELCDHREMIKDIKQQGLTVEWPCEVSVSAHFTALRLHCPTYTLSESEKRSATEPDMEEKEIFVEHYPKNLVECPSHSETMTNVHFPSNLTDSEARGCPEDDNAWIVYNSFSNAASCDSELSLNLEHPTNHRDIQPHQEECNDRVDVADAKLCDYALTAHVSTKTHGKAINSEAYSQAEHDQPCVEIYVRHLDFHKGCVQDNDASPLLDNPKRSTFTMNTGNQTLDPLTTAWQASQKDGLNKVPQANPTRMFETSSMVPDNSDCLELRLSPRQSSELKPRSMYSHLNSYRYCRRTQFGLKMMENLQIVIVILLALMLSKARHTRGVMVFLSVNAISLPGCAATSFSIIPSSQVVSVGEEAVFQCRYPTAYFIGWLVNGSIVGTNPPSDVFPSTVQSDNGTLVDTLTIVGRPEYNGTIVVCEAFFREGIRFEMSPEAMLVLIEFDTTRPPGEFVESPVDQVVAQGQQAVFNCQHATAHAIGWRLNGIPLLDTSLVGVEARSTSLPGGVLNTLTVEARPQYNLTRIECVAAFFDDSSSENTVAVTLTIQGPLNAVKNLASTRDPFMITWEPPFSLNLTDVEPDVIYCIEIVAILNCNEEVSVVSHCNVNTNNYYNAENLNAGYIYNVTVTPRSNGNSSLSGIPSVLEEKYTPFPNSSVSVNSISSDYQDFSITIHFNVTVKLEPSAYTLSLKAIDDPESFTSLAETKVVEDRGGVALNTTLPRRRLWWCTVFPYNCTESDQAISTADELSTHDIQNVSVTPFNQTGDVQVFGDFVTGTNAAGALIIAYSSKDTCYHLALREFEGNRRLATTISNLPSGTYKVSVFTIEENGVPFERVVTRPMAVHVTTSQDKSRTLLNASRVIEYELTSDSNSNGVNITCFFLEESTTQCVVIVHSFNSALTSSGVMNISSYVFARSEGGNSANGFIKGVNLQEYHFGVIGGELREDDVHTNVDSNDVPLYIAGTIVITTLVILSSLVLVAIFVLKLKKRQHRFREYEPSKSENMYMTQIELKNTQSGQMSHNSGAYQPSIIDEERVYDEATASPTALNESIQHEKSQDIEYASVTVACATTGKNLDTRQEGTTKVKDKTKVIYSDIRPHDSSECSHMEPHIQVSSQEENCIKKPVPVQMPFTVDNLFDQLWPLHDKWQELGGVMSLSEDLLDEIFTNNEDNESCLRDLLEFYMKAGERQHTWDEMHSFVKAISDEDLADKICSIHIQPYTHGPLKLQDDSETWSSAVEQDIHSHSKAECCQPQPQVLANGSLKPEDERETWSGSDVTKVWTPVPPFMPEGACQPKSEYQPQSPSYSAEVKVCSQTTDVTSIVTDHVTLRGKKDRPDGFQTSYTPHRYRSWPASVANSPYHHSVARASAPFILSRGSLQSAKKVERPLTQSHSCITEEGYYWNNVNDVGRAVSCSAMQTLGSDDSKGADEPKVDLCSESEPNDDRSQLSLNNCENF